MHNFEFTSLAKMTSGNPRKERHGEEGGELALDLDFAVETEAGVLNQMALGDEFDWQALYDQDGQVKNIGLKRLVFTREFEDHTMTLTVGDRQHTFEEVHLKKFSAEPVFGNRVNLKFQAQTHPNEDDVGPVLEGLVNGCEVSISGPIEEDGDE